MNYFTTFDSKCELCGRWRNHFQVLDNVHVTCVCFVLTYEAICCIKGFKCLIKEEPELINCIKNIPKTTNLSKMLFISYNDHFLNTEKEEIMKQCKYILQQKY